MRTAHLDAKYKSVKVSVDSIQVYDTPCEVIRRSESNRDEPAYILSVFNYKETKESCVDILWEDIEQAHIGTVFKVFSFIDVSLLKVKYICNGLVVCQALTTMVGVKSPVTTGVKNVLFIFDEVTDVF